MILKSLGIPTEVLGLGILQLPAISRGFGG